MSKSLALVRVTVSGGRWLLPWLSVLLVSAGLAAVMNSSLSASRATGDGQRQELALTSVGASVPSAETTVEEHASQVLSRSCTELFGSYNWWLFSSDGSTPCGLGPGAATPTPAQLSPTAALADEDDMRARSLAEPPEATASGNP